MNSFLRSLRISALLTFALAACDSSGESPANRPPIPLGQTRRELHRKVERPVELEYLLFVPEAYDATEHKLWPMILFLHGAGERGRDLERVKTHGPPKIVESKPDFPFIVVSPLCPVGRTWDDDELIELVDEVCDRCRVDRDRVYLTGLSMGGFGSWSLAISYPERFAAVAPICGGGSAVKAILYGDSEKGRALRTLPFWAFHGARDTVVPPSSSQAMVDALKSLGCEVEYTVYPDADHDSWTRTYDDPKLYEWFLAHSRKR